MSSPAELLANRQKLVEVLAFLDSIIAAAAPAEVAVPELAEVPYGLQKPAAFYDVIRGQAGELFPVMTQAQFLGIQDTLLCSASLLPLGWCAYVLATEYHETGKRMQAVREGFGVSDAWRKKHLSYYPWYGRGEVQLTHERNYTFATKRLRELGFDCDLVANPDQALNPKISTAIMVYGMLEGWFTGKKLRDYLPADPNRRHYQNARRIVNDTDRADLIAAYAETFEKALRAGDWR